MAGKSKRAYHKRVPASRTYPLNGTVVASGVYVSGEITEIGLRTKLSLQFSDSELAMWCEREVVSLAESFRVEDIKRLIRAELKSFISNSRRTVNP